MAIANAQVSIVNPQKSNGHPVTGVTHRFGKVDLNISNIDNGNYILQVVPEHAHIGDVGPNTAGSNILASRIFRPINVKIQIVSGGISAVNVAFEQSENGTARIAHDGIIIALQPVWVESPNHSSRSATITSIFIHETSSPDTASTINAFIFENFSIHYIIARDGKIVKMARETQIALHAGTTLWRGVSGMNDSSIGIEIVHQHSDSFFQPEQYTALIGLINSIRSVYPTIEDRNIIGHSDAAVNPQNRLGRKATCPGTSFDWRKLENENIGIKPDVGAPPADIYGDYYGTNSTGVFRLGDRDDSKTYGRTHRPKVSGNPIQEIQQDLTHIGYSVGADDGVFGEMLFWGIRMFQDHFFADGRGTLFDGTVDHNTAIMIKKVRAAI